MKCPICLSNDSNIFIDLGLQPFSHFFFNESNLNSLRKSLVVSHCQNCGHFFNSNPIECEFKEKYSFLSSSSQTLKVESKRLAIDLIDYFYKKFSKKPNLIIEIASNDGSLLEELMLSSLESKVVGIEPSSLAYKYSISKGHKVINDYFTYLNVNKIVQQIKGYPDIIVARNVINHIQDINDFFKGLEKIMSYNSILFLQGHYWLSLIENLNFDAIYHENYQYFSIKILIKLLKNYSINPISVSFSESHGGSFCLMASKNPSLCKDFNNKSFEINEKEFFRKLPIIVDKFNCSLVNYKNNFLDFLNKKKEQGKVVYGYGAPQKIVTLLNYFELDNTTIKMVADISPEKHNKYIPGTNIRICDPEYLLKINAEVIIVFAWNYYEEIKKQLINIGLSAEIISIEDFKTKLV